MVVKKAWAAQMVARVEGCVFVQCSGVKAQCTEPDHDSLTSQETWIHISCLLGEGLLSTNEWDTALCWKLGTQLHRYSTSVKARTQAKHLLCLILLKEQNKWWKKWKVTICLDLGICRDITKLRVLSVLETYGGDWLLVITERLNCLNAIERHSVKF